MQLHWQLVSALSTHFTKLLRLIYDQMPIISIGDEQRPRPSDAHIVAGRPPAVAGTTPCPFAAYPGEEPLWALFSHLSLHSPIMSTNYPAQQEMLE